MRAGLEYVLPAPVAAALETVLGDAVDGIVVVENSWYARCHLGMCATTRPNRILLAYSGAAFIAAPETLLHEYFHVVKQWRCRRLTRVNYLRESLLHGYWNNRFEREAREFAAAALPLYRSLLPDAS